MSKISRARTWSQAQVTHGILQTLVYVPALPVPGDATGPGLTSEDNMDAATLVCFYLSNYMNETTWPPGQKMGLILFSFLPLQS